MGWNSIPKPQPTPPGEWEEYGTNQEYIGWLLRCPPCFHAHVMRHGGDYYLTINSKAYGQQKSKQAALVMAELEIVRAVRQMLPVYKLLIERLEGRHVENIIPMKPKDGA